MARIRSIKPEFWTDEKIVSLKPEARLFFIGLWNFVDDEGRCQYSPLTLKLQILPNDKIDVEKICADLRRLALISTYLVNGKEYLEVTNFSKHQKIDKRRESKLPAPICAESRRLSPLDQGRDQGRDQGVESPPAAPKGATAQPKDFLEAIKQNPAYKHIDFEKELYKMDAWLAMPKNKRRTKNQAFVLNWLNKIDQPLPSERGSKKYTPPPISDEIYDPYEDSKNA